MHIYIHYFVQSKEERERSDGQRCHCRLGRIFEIFEVTTISKKYLRCVSEQAILSVQEARDQRRSRGEATTYRDTVTNYSLLHTPTYLQVYKPTNFQTYKLALQPYLQSYDSITLPYPTPINLQTYKFSNPQTCTTTLQPHEPTILRFNHPAPPYTNKPTKPTY